MRGENPWNTKLKCRCQLSKAKIWDWHLVYKNFKEKKKQNARKSNYSKHASISRNLPTFWLFDQYLEKQKMPFAVYDDLTLFRPQLPYRSQSKAVLIKKCREYIILTGDLELHSINNKSKVKRKVTLKGSVTKFHWNGHTAATTELNTVYNCHHFSGS